MKRQRYLKDSFSRGSPSSKRIPPRGKGKELKELYRREMMPSSETILTKITDYEAMTEPYMSFYSRPHGDHVRPRAARVRQLEYTVRRRLGCPFDESNFNTYRARCPGADYRSSWYSSVSDGHRLGRWTDRNPSGRRAINSTMPASIKSILPDQSYFDYSTNLKTQKSPYRRNTSTRRAHTSHFRGYDRRRWKCWKYNCDVFREKWKSLWFFSFRNLQIQFKTISFITLEIQTQ